MTLLNLKGPIINHDVPPVANNLYIVNAMRNTIHLEQGTSPSLNKKSPRCL